MMKKTIVIVLMLLAHSLISAQITNISRAELAFDETGIGRSLHLTLQHRHKALQISYGIRYHLNRATLYDQSNIYYQTMRPTNFAQYFGPTLAIDLAIPVRNWSATPFIGCHTQLGIMGRRVVLQRHISTGTWENFETDSPLYRWENQIIAGSYFPINKFLELKIFGGLGIAGLYNLDPRVSFVDDNSTSEYGYELGIGVSYMIGGE